MSIIYKGKKEEKLDLLYGFFDVDGDSYVSKEELMTVFF
jgi:Ca2+-binding EF-hand superfamily protein